jgi:hypothetical protein
LPIRSYSALLRHKTPGFHTVASFHIVLSTEPKKVNPLAKIQPKICWINTEKIAQAAKLRGYEMLFPF